MRWEKKGLVYQAREISDHLVTHASNPLPVHLYDDVYRVYFSGRDVENRSSIGWVDLDIVRRNIIQVCEKAAVTYTDGEGDYYTHGISIGNCYKDGDDEYILFMGWQIPEGEHWRGDIGQLRISKDRDTMTITSKLPYIGIDQEDPISLSYPYVLKEAELYRMWYGSTVSWDSANGEMIHLIKYATSTDGVSWDRHGVAIPWEINEAQAFSRPSVLFKNGKYHMWFSYRSGGGDKYKIGYANSVNGIDWIREECSGLITSNFGWDSEMVCYPFVFEHKDQVYMLYNGNSHGYDGFGLAILNGGGLL